MLDVVSKTWTDHIAPLLVKDRTNALAQKPMHPWRKTIVCLVVWQQPGLHFVHPAMINKTPMYDL